MTFLSNLIKDETSVKQFEREYYESIYPEKLIQPEPPKPVFHFGILPKKRGGCPVCGTPYRAEVRPGQCYLCLNCGTPSGGCS